MAKPRSGAKKATPAAKKVKTTKPGASSRSVPKRAAKAAEGEKAEKKAAAVKKPSAKKVVEKTAKAVAEKAVEKTAKAATRVKLVAAAAKKAMEKAASKVKEATKAAKEPVAKAAKEVAKEVKETVTKAAKSTKAASRVEPPPAVEKPRPRATKLPPPGDPLNKRDMEQLLTAGQGRGVVGEGSLKGRLTLVDFLPGLVVVGRDKRELVFILQGPDQEVLPAYVDHKVSVSGLIKKTTNYGGTVDVRKFSAKKPEAEEPVPEPVETEARLRYLSPGEVSQVTSAGMGAGMKGFAALRGNLEMMGEEFVLEIGRAHV